MQEQTFDLNLWDLRKHKASVQSWFQCAYQHNLSQLKVFEDASFCARKIQSVNVAHLFACGKPQGGTYASRTVLEYLLHHGADLSQPDAYGWLPINYACFFAFPATVDVLLEAGSPVQNSALPQPLDSALQSLSQHKNPSAETCARLLLMHGANPKLGLSSDMHWGGVTWLTWALVAQEFNMAELLYAKGLLTLSAKEKQLLLMRGDTEGFVWAEQHGISVLEHLPQSHDGYDQVLQARASHQKQILNSALKEKMQQKIFSPFQKWSDEQEGEPQESTDEGKGRGKRKL